MKFATLQWRRIAKFSVVGILGWVVNLAALWLSQEYLFVTFTNSKLRLYASLAVAIVLATVHNFFWHWQWTWADRRLAGELRDPFYQFGQYVLASAIGIVLQVLFTQMLVSHMHYLIANTVATLMTAVVNFLLNDTWTFSLIKPKPRNHSSHAPLI